MRVLRIARVLKLLKMAKGIRALLDTVMQALPQVGNLGLLFFLLFFIFAALGVELFGRLECSDENPCQGLGEHAHFANFGMAFLTLFRVATGDNWNGIMKDTLRDNCDDEADCVRNCCVSSIIAPIFFVIFVLMAQFVLVNVVVAVLMKHLEESHKQMEDELDMETELEREFRQEQQFEEEQALCLQLQNNESTVPKRPLTKVLSLPSNFIYTAPPFEPKFNTQRRQTLQYANQMARLSDAGQRNSMLDDKNSIAEAGEGRVRSGSRPSLSGSGNLFVDMEKRNNARRSPWRPKFGRDISLDERSVPSSGPRRYSEVKRMSCDHLLLRVDKNTNYYQRPLSSQLDKSSKTSIDRLSFQDGKGSQKELADRKLLFKSEHEKNNASAATSFLSLPKIQSVNRSGSSKQLFKQHALEEDPDIDENSLLLPVLSKPPSPHLEFKNGKETSLLKKDNADKSS